MNRGLLRQPVFDDDANALPLADPDLGAGHATVVAPHGRVWMGAPDERDLPGSGNEAKLRNGRSKRRCRARQSRRDG
jgi:hypothetical protein